jgi:surfeit locus 1 family protein
LKTARFWLLTLATALGIAVTAALAQWQMDRAAQKLALQAAIVNQRALPPVGAEALTAQGSALVHRSVVLSGTWVGQHTVFLDNRQMRGRPGFYVVTPLRLEGSNRVVVVQRGWVPRNFVAREQVPSIETPPGVVEVRGRIAPAPAKLYEFDGAASGPIRQNLDLGAFATETGLALLPLSVQQMGTASEGLLREWPQAASGVDKHYGYAFQWAALCGLIAILYVWFQFIAPRRRPRAP